MHEDNNSLSFTYASQDIIYETLYYNCLIAASIKVGIGIADRHIPINIVKSKIIQYGNSGIQHVGGFLERTSWKTVIEGDIVEILSNIRFGFQQILSKILQVIIVYDFIIMRPGMQADCISGSKYISK